MTMSKTENSRKACISNAQNLLWQNHTIISAIIKTVIEFQFKEAIGEAMPEEIRRDESSENRK